MVDLAKIRKKAKKVLGGEGETPAHATTAAPVAQPMPPPTVADAPQVRAPEEGGTAVPHGDKLERFKEQAGRRREVTNARVEEQVPQVLLELLTFTIAGEHYAVDIERIVEIVTPRAVTRIPNADPTVVGILSLRGTIVTLVDVRRRLRHPSAAQETPDTRVVVIDFHNETVGFAVDRVQRVVKIAASSLEPHPVVHAAELEASIRGVFRAGNNLTILLDLDRLLDHSLPSTAASGTAVR